MYSNFKITLQFWPLQLYKRLIDKICCTLCHWSVNIRSLKTLILIQILRVEILITTWFIFGQVNYTYNSPSRKSQQLSGIVQCCSNPIMWYNPTPPLTWRWMISKYIFKFLKKSRFWFTVRNNSFYATIFLPN